MSPSVVLGKQRFTCLTPSLVRFEYSPTGTFEDRPSIVASEPRQPRPFVEQVQQEFEGNTYTVLKTGEMELWTRDHERPFHRLNLEIRWISGGMVQFWRPGDRDYQNLGGPLRSLDRYGGPNSRLPGPHPATSASPDPSGTNWAAWTQCEIDPVYAKLHPDPPKKKGGGWLNLARSGTNNGSITHRSFNWYVDATKYSPGLLSRSGYYFLNDSDSAVLDGDGFPVERDSGGAQDHYFFAYGRDLQKPLRDWRTLAGPAPLPPHQSLGVLFSRWPAFTEDEVREMNRRFREEGYPLSVIILDMEWHKEGWGHWEINPDLLPDPEKFFKECHDAGLHVVFNDHPLDVRSDDVHQQAYLEKAGDEVWVRDINYNDKTVTAAKVDITRKQQNRAFVDVCHKPITDMGLDFWWNDGSRGQMIGTCGQLVANKTFFEEIENLGRRGMLLARYGGLGSHRYGGFFTGDTGGDWDMLTTQVEFNIRTGHVAHSWVSHDIGGFLAKGRPEKINPKLYLRWLQFGVFNPLLRFHSAPGAGSRLPYDYEEDVDGACSHWLRQRHALLPYLYTAGRVAYDTGIPITRGCFLHDPEDENAYRFDQYFFGPDMLVAPVTSEDGFKRLYLPPGLWYDRTTGRTIDGGVEIGKDVPLAEVPVFVQAGSVIPTRDPDRPIHEPFIDPLVLEVYPPAVGETGESELYEDDGASNDYESGAFSRTRFRTERDDAGVTLRIEVSEGEPLGEKRKLVVLCCTDAEPRATLNGEAVPDSAVQREGDRLRVDLPDMPTGKAAELRLG